MNRILLVSPLTTSGDHFPKSIRIPNSALYYLAAVTPPRYELTIIEEEFGRIDLDGDYDLIGISIMTANANRGYFLADEFRKRGRKVAIGGIHATVLPEEAMLHADAVCVGEGEIAWPQIIADCENRCLKGIYRSELPDLADPAVALPPRLDLLPRNFLNAKPIMCSRGCPYQCSFCSVHKFYGRKVRHVPVPVIRDTIARYHNKYWVLLDDNIVGNQEYAAQLFDAITPLNIRWVGQASIAFAGNTELMEKAARSGCAGLLFGLENVTVKQRQKFAKNRKVMPRIEEAIKRIKSLGIIFHATLIFGFDDDDESTFDETLEFLMKNNIASVQLAVLTPLPGTDLYEQFRKENRILTYDWDKYNFTNLVYKPRLLSNERFMEKYIKTAAAFFSYPSIAKRILHTSHRFVSLAMNIGCHQFYKMRSAMYLKETGSRQGAVIEPNTSLWQPDLPGNDT